MQTIKTAVVVVLLLVVLYGAYIAINGSQAELPAELQKMIANSSELEVDVSMSPLSKSEGTSTPSAGLTPSTGFGSTNSSFWNNAAPPASSLSTSGPAEPSTSPALTSVPTLSSTTKTLDPVSGPAVIAPLSPLPSSTTEVPASPLSIAPELPKAELASSPSNTPNLSPKPFEPTTTPSGFAAPPASLSNTSSPPGKLTTTSTPSSSLLDSSESFPATPVDSKTAEEASGAKKATLTGRSFENAKKTALELVDRNDFKGALATMSVYYNSPELSAEQSQDLLNLLDSLAGETIYSRRHLLDTPYVVGPGETLEAIAKRYEIPAELIAKINAVDSTLGPIPGTKLKVFQGPFRADVDVNKSEITLFLGDLYAGRFPISTGADPQPKEGVFQVVDKQRNRNYYGKGGLQIDGSDPRNPYGGWWIDLGQDLSIHGSPEAQASENAKLGCISLSPLDAGDVFSMLSRGSQVTIRR